jgi:hypothetical protein
MVLGLLSQLIKTSVEESERSEPSTSRETGLAKNVPPPHPHDPVDISDARITVIPGVGTKVEFLEPSEAGQSDKPFSSTASQLGSQASPPPASPEVRATHSSERDEVARQSPDNAERLERTPREVLPVPEGKEERAKTLHEVQTPADLYDVFNDQVDQSKRAIEQIKHDLSDWVQDQGGMGGAFAGAVAATVFDVVDKAQEFAVDRAKVLTLGRGFGEGTAKGVAEDVSILVDVLAGARTSAKTAAKIAGRRALQASRKLIRKKLGDPLDFTYGARKWWGAHIQSYGLLKEILKGEGLHQHHLVPQSLLRHGPQKTKGLIDYVPSIPLTEGEHLRAMHRNLDATLKQAGLWKKELSRTQLERAIKITANFYEHNELQHFAEAVREFYEKAYLAVK